LTVVGIGRVMRVPLHGLHEAAGAKFTEFAGFDMPVQFTSILDEHRAVREHAGLFDVSHMSNLWVRGKDAADLLSRTLAADARKVKDGRAQYTVACRDDGTILDDLIFYRFDENTFHVVPNAGMNKTFVDWFSKHAKGDVKIEDVSRAMCILALQGPNAREILDRTYAGLAIIKRFAFIEWNTTGGHGFVSGTGYTGEDGVELVVPNEAAANVWKNLLDEGKDLGLLPCGLGARDTLRLEKGFCLAPHEFKGGRSPLEANLAWVVDWEHEFVGKGALERQKEDAGHDRLVGLVARERGIPREDCRVRREGSEVGVVTSGTMSPSLRKGIALAYVTPEAAAKGARVAVDVRGRDVACDVVKPPFV
jgi:aminomethyltransferase